MTFGCSDFADASLIEGDCCVSCVYEAYDDALNAGCEVEAPGRDDLWAAVCCAHVAAVRALDAEAWAKIERKRHEEIEKPDGAEIAKP